MLIATPNRPVESGYWPQYPIGQLMLSRIAQ